MLIPLPYFPNPLTRTIVRIPTVKGGLSALTLPSLTVGLLTPWYDQLSARSLPKSDENFRLTTNSFIRQHARPAKTVSRACIGNP